jgi:hypothetical protein
MENGNVWSVWIYYNGTTLEVRVADNSTVRPASPILSTNINIASVIGQNTAYVGFTAGTGADAENHDILSWRYNDAFSPIGSGAVGTPALSDWTLILLAGILAAIGAYKMRPAGRPAV